ncbi:unnamed protein product [Brassicogethes aeneus]|uniref:Uncharacterized protein n=1 Tax=Brassicogethes aeneus TaxID=1431903 RepID=A0A9P0BD78_BRAAE|nr:unnamed protein product [Brassicogethes aeneus]
MDKRGLSTPSRQKGIAEEVDKKRKAPLIQVQKDMLIEFMACNPQLESGKFTSQFTFKKAQQLCEKISGQVNAVARGANKDWRQWRKVLKQNYYHAPRDKIILFVVDKLKKCQEVLNIRLKYKLKYSDIELPTEINKTDGYHRQCYGSFTALMAKYRDPSTEIDSTSKSTPHTLPSNTAANVSETIAENTTETLNSEIKSEVTASSLIHHTTSDDLELILNKEIIPEDAVQNLNNQCMSGHPNPSFNSEVLSEDEASSLDNQRMLGDTASRRFITNNTITKKKAIVKRLTPDIIPYGKRLKMAGRLIPVEIDQSSSSPTNFSFLQTIDLLHLLSYVFQVPNTPSWTGFNSRMIEDNTPKQKVSYLTPINLSPTNVSVVAFTLEQAQKVATEGLKFSNLFIHLGSFHLMMAFFKAVGTFIDECGLSHMMIESKIIASGSVNGIIDGKHFNRCKRLHPLMALGLQMLHFDANAGYDFVKGQIYEDLLEYQDKKISFSSLTDTDVLPNQMLSQLLNSYKRYVAKTRQAELQPNRIKIYGKQIADFIEILEKNCNPFDPKLDKENLYNISTSKPASPDVADFLLNIEENSETLRNQFISECVEDENRFDKPIKKNKVFNFAEVPKKKKLRK